MSIVQSEIFSPKSIAEVILEAPIPGWKKWVLRKLIPDELWEAPAVRIASLQKGAILGKVDVHFRDDGLDIWRKS